MSLIEEIVRLEKENKNLKEIILNEKVISLEDIIEKYSTPEEIIKEKWGKEILTEILTVTKRFDFAAAHRLPFYDGKCSTLHGHRWDLEITIEGNINKETGMIIDFAELKKIVDENIIDIFDHSDLNLHFLNPTAENIGIHIVSTLRWRVPKNTSLKKVTLWESEDSYFTWERK